MPDKEEQAASSGKRAWAWGLGALLFGLALSVAAAWGHHAALARSEHELQERRAERSFEAVEAQLRVCGLLVRSLQSLFLASGEVEPAEFASFHANLRPRTLFPSLQAMAYAQRQRGAGGDRFITTLVAPLAGNERVLGLDVGSQPANLRGLFASRDSDQPTMSGAFRLVQNQGSAASADGVVIRLPAYTPGRPPANVAERRARFTGSVAISFRVGDLLERALPEETRERMDVRISDASGSEPRMLFESRASASGAREGEPDRFARDLRFGGRTWRMELVGYDGGLGAAWQPAMTLAGGAVASLLLALLAWSIVGTRSRALAMARRMTVELRELNQMLAHQASHDPLTGLYNRREFGRRLDRSIAAVDAGGQSSALLYFDLDQFKIINDTSGHNAGDTLLTQLAAMLGSHLEQGETIARLGGDEFGILLAPATRERALGFAEQMRRGVDDFIFSAEQRTYAVSVSIGVVLIDRPGMTQRELLSLADTACYMAKERGRNRVHLYSETDAETTLRRSELEWASRLRQALIDGRFLLHYQELHPLGAGADEGVHIELLIRLRGEDGRMVAPGAFIPAAERFGLMPQLDRWVVETALANFPRLHRSCVPVRMCAINLSGLTVEDDGFADFVLERLQRYGVPPGNICFELTETAAVGSMVRAVELMTRLRDAGCKFSLDDFGAGMASFAYLKNLPVDYLKIDGSFIRNLETDPVSQSLVRASTEIGHQLGLKVIAEWVGDERVVGILRDMGVDYGQGFFLHAPEPAVCAVDATPG